jgi:hypothetical protein
MGRIPRQTPHESNEDVGRLLQNRHCQLNVVSAHVLRRKTVVDPLWHRLLRRSASESGRLCHGATRGNRCRTVLVLATLSTPLLLPRCYQNTPYQDDLGRHAASPDRFGLFGLGRLECPEYVVGGNS